MHLLIHRNRNRLAFYTLQVLVFCLNKYITLFFAILINTPKTEVLTLVRKTSYARVLIF